MSLLVNSMAWRRHTMGQGLADHDVGSDKIHIEHLNLYAQRTLDRASINSFNY